MASCGLWVVKDDLASVHPLRSTRVHTTSMRGSKRFACKLTDILRKCWKNYPFSCSVGTADEKG